MRMKSDNFIKLTEVTDQEGHNIQIYIYIYIYMGILKMNGAITFSETKMT